MTKIIKNIVPDTIAFYIENNLKPNCKIKFVRKFIPEGLKSYDTKYEFEIVARGK